MASNVFGRPITNENLAIHYPEYKDRNRSQLDRARAALELKNAEEKDVKARKFVEGLEQRYTGKCTIVLIYNATGNPLSLYTFHHWYGRFGQSPVPSRIENGQWGAFVHGHPGLNANDKSKVALVYSGKMSDTDTTHNWLLGWSTSNDNNANMVYTDFFKFEGTSNCEWSEIDKKIMSNYFNSTNRDGVYLIGSTGDTANTVVEGIFTLSDAWFPLSSNNCHCHLT